MDLFRHIAQQDKRTKLERLRSAAEPILANNLLPHFTDHSVSHSDEMVRIVDKFIDPLQTQYKTPKLSDDELYVLYASCYLHDIGMQYEDAGNTRIVSELGLGQPWNELDEETRRGVLRQHHHEISAEMVQNSVRSATPPIGTQLDERDHASEIACLCESHGTDAPSDRYEKLTKAVASLRLPVLAALLRIADILEESRRRALREKARTLLLDIESQLHWWRHYYTERCEVSPESRKVTLHYDLPRGHFHDYKSVIPRLQLPFIEEEFKRHLIVLNEVGLYFTLHHECPDKEYSTAEEMPEDVFNMMREKLRLQDERDREQRRRLALHESSQRCQELIVIIGSLTEGHPSQEQFMGNLLPRVQELWREGGKRSAWMLLASPYQRTASLLGPDNRVKAAIILSEMMLKDRFPREAVRILIEIQGLVGALPEDHVARIQFSPIWARALSLACHADAVGAYSEAIRLCPDEDERKALIAELAEHQFLQGELEQVRTLTKEALDNISDSRHCLRERLVALRNLAMIEGRRAVIPHLAAITQSAAVPEKVAALMLKAEIIFLDGDARGAMEVFCNEIDPILTDDGSELTHAVADNRNVIAAHCLDIHYARDFYALVDERRRRNIDIWDAQEILSADESASEGKHYEALPKYWAELVRTFGRGYWRGYWWASERMALECLALNLPHEAALHAMAGDAHKLAEPIAAMLFQARNPELVTRTVATLLRGAQLARHAAFAASLLEKLGDIIQETDLPEVAVWLAIWACRTDLASPFTKTPTAAWGALAGIAYRLHEKECDEVIAQARRHPAWSGRGQLRKHIIVAVNGCVTSASAETLSQLSEDCLRLVTEWKSDFDYSEALNLICHVHSRVDEERQKAITSILFPPGKGISDPKMLQVAVAIGKELGDEAQWSNLARSAASIVSQHVQQIAPGDKPAVAPGSYATHISFARPGEKQVIVQMDSGVYLDALFGNCKKICAGAIGELISALCAMIREPENSIDNKRILVNALRRLADVIPECSYNEVRTCLKPLYEGQIVEPTSGMTHAEAENPLNPFKMSMGDPKQLRGEALIAAAKFSGLQKSGVAEEFERALRETLTDDDGKMRRLAFAAVRELTPLPPTAISALIMGTRDSDPAAARMAFDALVWRESLSLDDSNWRLLLFSLRMALGSDAIELRRIAAKAIAELLTRTHPEEIRSELSGLQATALKDICYSVRASAESKAT